MKITPKQERFVEQYLIDLNATQAAIRAGYSRKTANKVGPRLLVNVGVAAAVAEGKKRLTAKLEITADRVLLELASIAFNDVRGFYRPDGKLKSISELTPEQGAALESFEIIRKNVDPADGKTDIVHRIKFVDKIGALTLLARYFGLLKEKVEMQGEVVFRRADELEEKLLEGRRRAASLRVVEHNSRTPPSEGVPDA
jgi:phage terminase small subunit